MENQKNVGDETLSQTVPSMRQMTDEYFARRYERGFQTTSRFLSSRGVHNDCVAEIAQAAWVKAWERREQLRDVNLLGTWVNTIALNMYRTSFRHPMPVLDLTDVESLATYSHVSTVDVDRILQQCKPSERIVLEGHYIYGYKLHEIAEQNNWTETAVRIRLLRARRKMKEMFSAQRKLKKAKARKAASPIREEVIPLAA